MKNKAFFELPDKIFGLDSALIVIFVKPIGLFLVLLIVFNLVIFPRIGDIGTGFEQINETNLKDNNLREKIKYLKSIDQESLQRDETLVTSALMPEKNSYFLVNVVKKIADKYGYTVDSFSVRLGEVDKNQKAQLDSGKGYVAVPVDMVLVGPSQNYYDLSLGLEKSLPIIKIDNFDMKNLSGVSTIDLKVDGFYISEKKLVESSKLTLADLTLKKEETELVSQLNSYEVLSDLSNIAGSFSQQKDFVKYQRQDPFSQ